MRKWWATTLAQLSAAQGPQSKKVRLCHYRRSLRCSVTHSSCRCPQQLRCCTLVGDFEQNLLADHESAESWTSRTKPSANGCLIIHSPCSISRALMRQREPLDARSYGHQYRFGPKLTELAQPPCVWGNTLRLQPPGPRVRQKLCLSGYKRFRNEGFVHRGPNGSGRYWGLGAAITVENCPRVRDFEGVGVVDPLQTPKPAD